MKSKYFKYVFIAFAIAIMIFAVVKIKNDEYETVYAHCSQIYVEVNSQVKQGELIAAVGSTGNSTGNHLHFEVLKDGEYIDPLNVIEK